MPEVYPVLYVVIGAVLAVRGLVYWDNNRKK